MYTRMLDMVENKDLYRDIRGMLELCCNTRRAGTKVRQQLYQLHILIMFGENFIRNAIAKNQTDSDCVH